MHAAQIMQSVFAVVATSSRELGTLSVIEPPIQRATTWTALPTEFSSVVLVVEKPRSRMMIVEKELTTPFGTAAAN